MRKGRFACCAVLLATALAAALCTARAQPALPGMGTGCVNIAGVSCAAYGRVMGVAAAIPVIAANSAIVVTATVPGIMPGDNANITLAVGSSVPPASIVVGATFCTTPGVLSIKYGYLAGSLGGSSTAVNVTLNVEFSH